MSELIWNPQRPEEAGLWRMRRRGAEDFAPVTLHGTIEGFLVTSMVEPPPALWLHDAAFDAFEWNGPIEIPSAGSHRGQRWFCRATGEWFVWTGSWWVPVRRRIMPALPACP